MSHIGTGSEPSSELTHLPSVRGGSSSRPRWCAPNTTPNPRGVGKNQNRKREGVGIPFPVLRMPGTTFVLTTGLALPCGRRAVRGWYSPVSAPTGTCRPGNRRPVCVGEENAPTAGLRMLKCQVHRTYAPYAGPSAARKQSLFPEVFTEAAHAQSRSAGLAPWCPCPDPSTCGSFIIRVVFLYFANHFYTHDFV